MFTGNYDSVSVEKKRKVLFTDDGLHWEGKRASL